MSVATRQDESQPNEAEELVRSLGQIPEVSPELRSRVMIAAADATVGAKRQRGWTVAAAFTAACAAAVLGFAFFGNTSESSPSDSFTEGNSTLLSDEEAVNKTLIDPNKVISSGMGLPGSDNSR